MPEQRRGSQDPSGEKVRHGALETPREQVARFLRAKIRSGAYPPESKLPSQLDLAELHGTSAGTVSNAIDILAGEGLVVKRPRYGTFVRGGD
jgi:DNA-binding GntR family transcriptional regulator